MSAECPISEKKKILESMNRLRNAGLIDWEEIGKDEDGFPIVHILKINKWESKD